MFIKYVGSSEVTPVSYNCGSIVPVKYWRAACDASAAASLPENQMSYKVTLDEEGIHTEQEYIPVETQPPVNTVSEPQNANAEPEGSELSCEPENKLTQMKESG